MNYMSEDECISSFVQRSELNPKKYRSGYLPIVGGGAGHLPGCDHPLVSLASCVVLRVCPLPLGGAWVVRHDSRGVTWSLK